MARTRRPRPQEGAALVAGPRQGLSAARIEAEIARQHGKCALCLRPLDEPFVDHDHVLAATHGHDPKRGCVRCFRAILCRRCNNTLAWAWDDPDFLERCATYIRLARSGALRG